MAQRESRSHSEILKTQTRAQYLSSSTSREWSLDPSTRHSSVIHTLPPSSRASTQPEDEAPDIKEEGEDDSGQYILDATGLAVADDGECPPQEHLTPRPTIRPIATTSQTHEPQSAQASNSATLPIDSSPNRGSQLPPEFLQAINSHSDHPLNTIPQDPGIEPLDSTPPKNPFYNPSPTYVEDAAKHMITMATGHPEMEIVPDTSIAAWPETDLDKRFFLYFFLFRLREKLESYHTRPLLMDPIESLHFPTKDQEPPSHIKDIGALEILNGHLETAISNCERVLAKLRDMVASNRERIMYTKAWLSSIRGVPFELWMLIFDVAVFEGKVSPWVLTSVSRIFRVVAFGRSKLWARIKLDISYSGKGRYVGLHEICRTRDELNRALLRSGQCNLTIKIESSDVAMAYRLHEEAFRWNDLTYDLSKIPVTVEDALFGRGSNTHVMSRLAVVQNASRSVSRNFTNWVALCRPRQLSYVHHPGLCDLKALCVSRGTSSGRWSILQKFEMVFEYSRNVPRQEADANIVLNIIRAANNTLTELVLKHITCLFATTPVMLSNVTTLTLINVNGWWNFIGNSVTKLELDPFSAIPGQRSILYPELVSLDYHSGDFSMGGSIRAPKLDTLVYRRTGKSPGGFLWEDANGGATPSQTVAALTPKTLCMHEVNVRYADLIRGLESLTEVEEVHFHSSKLRAGFLKPMADGRRARPLLPRLRTMVVGLEAGGGRAEGSHGRETYTLLFENIVAARRPGPDSRLKPAQFAQLRHLEVQWSKEMNGGTTFFLSDESVERTRWDVQ